MKEKYPNFFIVGAPKCGTTSMYEYLKQHPNIYMPDKLKAKEPHHFGKDIKFEQGNKYEDFDRYISLFEGAEGHKRVGEASVWYLFSESAAREIYEYNPEAKIIIMLRNPADMIYSLHHHLVFEGVEYISDFNDALAAETKREAGLIPYVKDQGMCRATNYLKVGEFSAQVNKYINRFGKANVHILLLEDFVEDKMKHYKSLLRFLEVEEDHLPQFNIYNTNKTARIQMINHIKRHPPMWLRKIRYSKIGRSKIADKILASIHNYNTAFKGRVPMDPATREMLNNKFHEDIVRLSDIINKDLSHWYE